VGSFGSVVFRFVGTGAANGFAAALVRREGHPIDFHFDADDRGSSAFEGMWWLPAESSTAYLILSNPTSKPVTGKLILSDASGAVHRLSLTVGPRQSMRTNLREALRAPANGAFGGLTLSTAKEGGLSATEIVFDEVTGLATILKLFDRQSIAELDKVKSRVLRAPMMALSQPDRSLGFPSGTVLEPKIFLRNAGPAPTVISPGVNWCFIKEHSTFPNTNNATCPAPSTANCFYPPSPPWSAKGAPGSGFANPTDTAPGIDALTEAQHDLDFVANLAFVKPYSASSFSGTQVIQYQCNGGSWVTLYGPVFVNFSMTTNVSGKWVVGVSRSDTSVTSEYLIPNQ
jgi:hypothetical protein